MAVNGVQSQTSRVSVSQLEKLLDFLESHEDLALGHCRSNEGRHRNKRLWNEVAGILNSIGDGANKDGVAWSKYWTIFKNRLKTKIRGDCAARRQTGASNIVFTPLEERAMAIVGNDAGAPLGGVDPLMAQEAVLEITPVEVLDAKFIVDSESIQFEQHSPGPSATAPVTPAPAIASPTPVAVRPIRRQKTRPRAYSFSEARLDIVRLEEARVAAELRNAEALQNISTALLSIATAISELAAVIRREHQI